MKKGFFQKLVFAQSSCCLAKLEKHASLVRKSKSVTTQRPVDSHLANIFQTHVCCKSHEAIFFKERFTLICVCLKATQFWENKAREESCPKLQSCPKPGEVLPRICFCFAFACRVSAKDEARKLYSNEESFELLLLLLSAKIFSEAITINKRLLC